MIERVAVLGPGRIGRQIALAFALGGCRVLMVDLKQRSAEASRALFLDARREIERDLRLMAEEAVIGLDQLEPALERLEDRRGLDGLEQCEFIQEAMPESVDLKREVFRRSGASAHTRLLLKVGSRADSRTRGEP